MLSPTSENYFDVDGAPDNGCETTCPCLGDRKSQPWGETQDLMETCHGQCQFRCLTLFLSNMSPIKLCNLWIPIHLYPIIVQFRWSPIKKGRFSVMWVDQWRFSHVLFHLSHCEARRVVWALCLECGSPDVCDKLTSCPPNHFNFDGDNSNGCESVCMILDG